MNTDKAVIANSNKVVFAKTDKGVFVNTDKVVFVNSDHCVVHKLCSSTVLGCLRTVTGCFLGL